MLLTLHSSTVIQHLQFRSRPIVAKPELPASSAVVYFYFDFRNSEQQHTGVMLCSLLGQVANQLTVVPEEICGLWEKYKGKKARPSPRILTLVVREYFNKVYIILDALDECSERQELLPILHQLMDRKCVSLFLTSRSEHDIRKSFSELSIYSTAIESADVTFDVELFVNRQIEAIEALRDLGVDLQKETIQRLVERGQGNASLHSLLPSALSLTKTQVSMGCLPIGYSKESWEAKSNPQRFKVLAPDT